MSDTSAIEDAEDHGLINGGSGVQFGHDGGYGGALPSQPPRKYGLRPTRPHTGVRGQYCVHRVGKPRHRRTGACQAHRHPEAFRARSDSEWQDEAHPRFNCVPAGRHLDQAAALPAMAGVRRGYLEQEGSYHLRDLCPQEGVLSPRLSSRVTSALKRGVSQTWVARPELDINLNPGAPSHSGDAPGRGLRTQIRVTDWIWADISTDERNVSQPSRLSEWAL